MTPTPKTIFLLLFCCCILGCASHRYEYFKYPYVYPTKNVKVGPYIRVTSDRQGIFFIAWRDTRRAPYALELSFISEIMPDVPVVLSKVSLQDTDGLEHKLLDKEVKLTDFRQRRVAMSHKTLGSYDGMAFEAKWTREDLPLTFKEGKSCKIKASYSIGGKVQTEEWILPAMLDKGTQDAISRLRSY